MKNNCILLILVLILLTCGCAKWKKDIKHAMSNITGLNREITLYNCEGIIIKQWDTTAKIEISGSAISFLDNKGKEIKIMGTVTVIEK